MLLKQSVDSEAGLSAEAAAQLREAHEAQRLFGLPVSVVAGACYCGASMSMVGGCCSALGWVGAGLRRLALLAAPGGRMLAAPGGRSGAAPTSAPPSAPPSWPPSLSVLPPPQVLLNKLALSSFSFQSATALLFFQCALVVALVQGCAAAGLVQVEPLRLAIIKVWLPVNLLFVAMIATSFWALQSLNIAMITGGLGRGMLAVAERGRGGRKAAGWPASQPSGAPAAPAPPHPTPSLLCPHSTRPQC